MSGIAIPLQSSGFFAVGRGENRLQVREKPLEKRLRTRRSFARLPKQPPCSSSPLRPTGIKWLRVWT